MEDAVYAPLGDEGGLNTIPQKETSAKKASLGASIFNLCNTTVGAGIVSIPYFFAQSGVVLGTALMILVAAASTMANYLMIAASERCGEESFIAIARAAYGPRGLITVQVSILLLTAGIMSAFYVQMGATGNVLLDTLLPSSYHGAWWTEDQIVKLVLTVPLLPLALMRNLSALSNVSLLVLVAIGYLVVVVVALGSGKCGDDDDADDCDDDNIGGGMEAVRIGEDFFAGVSIMALSFGNQPNVPEIIRELDRPTKTRPNAVIVGASVIISAAYLVIGVAGYAHFGKDGTSDNIITNYHGLAGGALGLFTAARVGILGVVVCSFPMLLFPCRLCLHFVLSGGGTPGDGKGFALCGAQLSDSATFVGQTVAIMGFAFLVAWVVPTLGTIMGFTGAVMGTLSGFIFPAHWYLMLDDGTGPDTHPRTRAAAWATLVFGVVIGVVCFAAQVWSTIKV